MLKSFAELLGAMLVHYWSLVILGLIIPVIEVWPHVVQKLPIPPSYHGHVRHLLWFVAIAGIFLAAGFAYHDLRVKVEQLTEELAERYQKAVADLNADTQAGRILAIATLQDIASRHEEYRETTLDVLTTRIRERSPAPEEPGRQLEVQEIGDGRKGVAVRWQRPADIHEFSQTQRDRPLPVIAPDIRRMVEVVCALPKPSEYRVDLSETDLSGVVLENCTLDDALFTAATLRRAVFRRSQLRRANFDGAILVEADFAEVVAPEATFFMTTAHRVHFEGSDISKAKFRGADLYDASIQRANGTEADFSGCQMWRLSAGRSNLKGAVFMGAMIEAADFAHALNLTAGQFAGPGAPSTDHNTRLPKFD